MAQSLMLALLLAAIFCCFPRSIQVALQSAVRRRRALVWAAPLALTAVFVAASAMVDALSVRQTAVVLAYTSAPVWCRYKLGRRGELLTILLLWLPIEFAAGFVFVPRTAYGFLHTVIYGIAILLGLLLFLIFEPVGGMKIKPPCWSDVKLAMLGFALVAPVLAVVGVAIGFIPAPHAPVQPWGKMAAAFGIIFAGTALPEEILFRALIQNLLMQRFGSGWRTLLAASLIFGAAHLDNGPQALPNWRYMILATIAGVAYGRVFQRASSVTLFALLHMMVDWTKHFFF